MCVYVKFRIQGVREKIVQWKNALVWWKLKTITNETYINVTNEVFAFECRFLQLIWTLQSVNIAVLPVEVKEPIVPLFDVPVYRTK